MTAEFMVVLPLGWMSCYESRPFLRFVSVQVALLLT